MRVLVGLSGGVDSSQVVAHYRERGDDVVACTLVMQHGDWPIPPQDALRRARRTCEMLGVELVEQDVSDLFAPCVRDRFLDAYLAGMTPSPCVTCNLDVKFSSLLKVAHERGCDRVATGHYVGRVRGTDGVWRLSRATDPDRDQSYFLCLLPGDVVEACDFPLAEMTKVDTRALAREEGLPAADAHDSQGVCFAPDGDYRELLVRERPDAFVPGDIVDAGGHVLGHHAGTVGFTIGQRKGLGLAQGPFFVQSIDPTTSTVVVGRGRMPAVPRFELTQATLSCGIDEANDLGLQAQTHFHAKPCPARLVEGEGGSLMVEVGAAGVLAVTGQACALYHGDVVMGGGIIGRVVTASA